MNHKMRAVTIVAAIAAASIMLASGAFAQGNDRPGNGFGDRNHHHTGPPGQSDRENGNGHDNGNHGNNGHKKK